MTQYQDMTKSKLRAMYRISPNELAYYMNVVYYEELQKVGYTSIHCKNLTPRIVRRFIELHDLPLRKDEI